MCRSGVASLKLRGNSTGRACRIRQANGELHRVRVLRPCRIRQAKGELHRARVLRPCRIRQAKGELHRARVLRPCRIRQAKGNSTGRVLRPGGIPQGACPGVASARVESVKLRGNSTRRASRCRLRPCRIRQANSRGNSTGHACTCRLRPCRIRQAKGELHRARVQVSPPPVSNPSSEGGTAQGTRPGVASVAF